jgi:hypothetical protein
MGRVMTCTVVGYGSGGGVTVPPDPADAAELTIGTILNVDARGGTRTGVGDEREAVVVRVSTASSTTPHLQVRGCRSARRPNPPA